MNINTFKLEEYLTEYEFSAKYLLCCSDAQSFNVSELIEMASLEHRAWWDNFTLSYTEPYGHPVLREKIVSALYPELSAKNILCFAGAEEGIFTALSVICQKDDHVIVLTPCYQSLSEIPKSQGAFVTELPLKEQDQWRINLSAINDVLQANTKCIIINFPHNPTGQIIEESELKGLIDICESRGIWLFSDEVYRLLGQPNQIWTKPAACLYDKALSLGVMSKAYGMPGLRVGWIACRNEEMIHKMKLMKDYLSICNSAPSEILSVIALCNQEKILARNNQIVDANLKTLDQFFIEYNHLFEWVRPQGGCVGFVKYKGSETVDHFCDQLVKETSVLLLPSTVYSYNNNYFRIGFGRKNMPECLEKFKEFLDCENH